MLRVLLSVLLAHLVRISGLSDTLSLRLKDGPNKCSGRVEIQNGTWGTICGSNWDLNDARVLCRQLSCGEAVNASRGACFGQGSGPILHQVGCSGKETTLSQCALSGFNTTLCGHGEDAGVVCTAETQLPIPSIICPDSAVRPGENIQITCSKPPQTCTRADFYLHRNGQTMRDITSASHNSSSKEFSLFNMTSSKQGMYSCHYSFPETTMKSPQSEYINITVVTLEQPGIFRSSEEEVGTLSTPHPHSSTGTQPVEVTKGHSFSIICYTESQYKGGSFQLLLNGTSPGPRFHTSANRTSIEQPHHLSTSFLFPEAGDHHQGSYTCVYEVTVGRRLFNSSQSEPLRVTVKDSWLLLLLLVGGGLLLLFFLLLSIFLAWRYHHGNKHKKASLSDGRYTTEPDGGVSYRRNEPIEDDERDYESMADEDREDYINTATLGCETGSSGDEEDYVNTETLGNSEESLAEEGDYVNTETLGNSEESLAEEGDYVNTETLGDGVGDYECMEKHSEHSDGDDYVNVDPSCA